MSKVSIIIPSRNEEFLQKTVNGIFANARGEIEVIVVLDGPTEQTLPLERENLIFIKKDQPEGLREGVNSGVSKASGEYLLKCDSHCMFAEGFDEVLKQKCEDNWIVIARRFNLHTDPWERYGDPVDYFYLSCPWNSFYFYMRNCPWIGRTRERADLMIDDTMTFQGSMWFTTTNHFRKRIHSLGGGGYKSFGAEQQEIGLKTWLGGGRVVVNKNTWYAHPGRRNKKPCYRMSQQQVFASYIYSARYWTEDRWKERVRDFGWLVDKFWPLPLEHNRLRNEKYYWPEDWRKYYEGKK